MDRGYGGIGGYEESGSGGGGWTGPGGSYSSSGPGGSAGEMPFNISVPDRGTIQDPTVWTTTEVTTTPASVGAEADAQHNIGGDVPPDLTWEQQVYLVLRRLVAPEGPVDTRSELFGEILGLITNAPDGAK